MNALIVAVDGSEGSRAAVDEALALARGHGATLTFVCVRKPGSSIHADLIVIGSRSHGALAGALLGSVSRAVVQHAHVPVLVAKHRPAIHTKVA